MRAHVGETLVHSDAVTVLMIHDEAHRKHIAIGMPNADGTLTCVSAPIHPEILVKVRTGRTDLRDAFLTSRERYMFELAGESVTLCPTSDDALLPAAGFRCQQHGRLVESGASCGRRKAQTPPLGDFLRNLRDRHNESLAAMAEKIRTPDGKPIVRTFLSMIETGARFAPSYFLDAVVAGYCLGKREADALRHAADASPQRYIVMPRRKNACRVAAQFTRQLECLSDRDLAAIQSILNRARRSDDRAL